MKTKRILALLMAAALFITCFTACGKSTTKETTKTEETTKISTSAVNTGNWSAYDTLITKIKSSTDFVAREALMHQAEDILMNTGAVCPIYYYNDVYMMKPGLTGFYATVTGYKFFM